MDQLLQGMRFIDESLLFVYTMSHIPPIVFLSRDDVRDFGKHVFRSVLLDVMLSNATFPPPSVKPVMQVKSSQKTSSGLGNITFALSAVHFTHVCRSSSYLVVNWSQVKPSKIVFFALIIF